MKEFTERELDRIIEMAWEDRTPFEAITFQFGISEQETIEIMRREMKPSSFRMWRKRVQGRATKHAKLRGGEVDRFKCSRQKNISGNKVSKR
ncbi:MULTISPECIES: TIGR03643 family protein [Croceitalea]|uniref:TIGR03643 family protein n=1 Tax=Croceitalea vernalis TaxID=3075599 RepID=A0ABU3BKX0_9FLAO|nr:MULTISPECIES: TIGR03643 family protein [unclassified Croceitalea]MDT0540832.1 TIGR03643 family protein [Croceitalea sp. P059]MDT0622811.1 TIGR03643 family protein [Croceitalea sp. P007]